MMRIAGIVVEYNPMHNGHLYHLQQTKQVTGADAVVAVMSGHFLQRGEPAMIDKWTRTEMALRNGIDLVLELPFVYANQSATQFAFGALATLDGLGSIDAICFGSENGDLTALLAVSHTLEQAPKEFQDAFLNSNAQGLSFPKAMANAVSRVVQDPDIQDVVNKPNNALGIAYLRALSRLQSTIKPYTIQRTHTGYHTPTFEHDSIASATAIRNLLLKQQDQQNQQDLSLVSNYIPKATKQILSNYLCSGMPLITWEKFAQAIFIKIETHSAKELAQYLHMDEALAYRIHHAAKSTYSVHELIKRVKTRRFTWTRIQRALMSLLLGQTKETMHSIQAELGPSYIRVLGFNETGRQILKQAKKTARLPILTNISQPENEMLQFDLLASRVYARAFHSEAIKLDREQAPVLFVPTSVSEAAVSGMQSHPPTF
jgi:predicted nucleotidyltransferase